MCIYAISEAALIFTKSAKDLTAVYLILITILHSIKLKKISLDKKIIVDQYIEGLQLVGEKEVTIRDRADSAFAKLKKDYNKCYNERTGFPLKKVIFTCIYWLYLSIIIDICPLIKSAFTKSILCFVFIIGVFGIVVMIVLLIKLLYKTNNFSYQINKFSDTILNFIQQYDIEIIRNINNNNYS